MKNLQKFLKRKEVRVFIVIFIVVNLLLTIRSMSEGIKSEDICMKYGHTLELKDSKYWSEKIPSNELSERERKWVTSSDGYFTRSNRAILQCENERNSQTKYFILF